VYTVTFRDLERFATEGLRTLVFAARILPESEYVAWKRIYNDASSALTNRQERIESAAEGIEQALQLLGATAIEDKLQEGVPDTIDKLRRANIRVWMLTGDKRETAINIAHSAGICLPNSDIYTLDAKEKDLDGQIQLIQEGIHSMPVHRVAVLDGHTLSEIDKTTHLQDRFYTLLPLLDSVICCRASPRQKADIVKTIKSRIAGSLTLAIGDGANDIAMIQASVSLASFLLSSPSNAYLARRHRPLRQRRPPGGSRRRLLYRTIPLPPAPAVRAWPLELCPHSPLHPHDFLEGNVLLHDAVSVPEVQWLHRHVVV